MRKMEIVEVIARFHTIPTRCDRGLSRQFN